MARSPRTPRTRWSLEQARAVLKRQERSGLSVRRFAEKEGLDAERLYRWQRKLREERRRKRFVEVRAEGVVAPVEVVLRSGHRLLLRGATDVDVLAAIVTTLEREC